MSPFIETAAFPGAVSYGYSARPRYRTEVIVQGTGRESRFRLWEYPLHDYTVTVGPRDHAEMSRVLEFYHACGGQYYGFRFRDYADFKSCYSDETPSRLDQPLIAAGGNYQLIKRYTAGSVSQDRPIIKPIASTIIIADDGDLVDPAGYTLNAATGIVTFSVAVTGPLRWGGEFDVPVRFTGDFPIEIIQYQTHSVTFGLEELR